MRNTLWASVALVLLGLTGSSANAYYYCAPEWCYYCYCPPPCVAYEARVVTCYRPEWQEEKIPVVIQRVNYRAETTKVNVTVYVPQMFDQKVVTSYYVPIPKIIERDVMSCVMVPVMMVDPCTGCCYTSCPQWVAQKVQCTVYDYQLNSRESVVKVCKMVPEVRVVDQTRYIPEVTQEKSWTVRRYCVMVPYQTTVNVPVYVSCCP